MILWNTIPLAPGHSYFVGEYDSIESIVLDAVRIAAHDLIELERER